MIMNTEQSGYITENDFFNEGMFKNVKDLIQCSKIPSLFKEYNEDGSFKYTDCDRVICYDVNDPNKIRYLNNYAKSLVDDMFPITMPYYPKTHNKYEVYFEKDNNNIRFIYIVTPEKEKVILDKYA